MSREKRRQELLEKADEADRKAEKSTDYAVKKAWLEIAEMYRAMAKLEH